MSTPLTLGPDALKDVRARLQDGPRNILEIAGSTEVALICALGPFLHKLADHDLLGRTKAADGTILWFDNRSAVDRLAELTQ